MRLAALMGLSTIYIFTHDSIGVGEDGPTHQPVEHLAALRAIPGLVVLRPGDANEVAEAYKAVMRLCHQPAALVLTRQNLPTLDRNRYAPASGTHRGGYILADAPGGKPQVILIGTGSEVSLCVAAYESLKAEGIAARVVSLPSWELFDAQPDEYRHAVLPPEVTARVAVEMGIEQGWSKYLGVRGRFIGMSGFGASAPMGVLLKHFGFTVEHVVAGSQGGNRFDDASTLGPSRITAKTCASTNSTLQPRHVGGAAAGYRVVKRTLQTGMSKGVDLVEVDNGAIPVRRPSHPRHGPLEGQTRRRATRLAVAGPRAGASGAGKSGRRGRPGLASRLRRVALPLRPGEQRRAGVPPQRHASLRLARPHRQHPRP